MSWNETVADHKRRTRSAIASKAVGVISVNGVAGTSMTDVARAAGITRKTLYSYFPDLESILVEHVQTEVAYLRERFAQRVEPDPLDHIRTSLIDALVRWSDDPTAGLLGLGGGLTEPAAKAIREAMAAMHADLIEVLQEAVDVGRVRPDLDLSLLADILTGMLLGAREHALRTQRSPVEIADAIDDLMLRGIRGGA
jgi:AcrR family transcriptional regulator